MSRRVWICTKRWWSRELLPVSRKMTLWLDRLHAFPRRPITRWARYWSQVWIGCRCAWPDPRGGIAFGGSLKPWPSAETFSDSLTPKDLSRRAGAFQESAVGQSVSAISQRKLAPAVSEVVGFSRFYRCPATHRHL